MDSAERAYSLIPRMAGRGAFSIAAQSSSSVLYSASAANTSLTILVERALGASIALVE